MLLSQHSWRPHMEILLSYTVLSFRQVIEADYCLYDMFLKASYNYQSLLRSKCHKC